MKAAENLLLAVEHALRVERGHLQDLREDGWNDESLPVTASEFNISMYRLAIEAYKTEIRKGGDQ